MPTPDLVALLVFASAMSFSPGPNNTLAAALAANHGLRRAMRFVVAVPFGWGLLLTACALGLGGLVKAVPALHAAIQWFGIGYLVFMAWKLGRSGTVPAGAAGSRRGDLDVGFARGVALQFVNIKAWTSALLVSAGWITVVQPPWPRLAIVLPVMMAYGFASNFTYALVGSALRGWLAQGRRLAWFNRVLALVLLGTAAWIAQL